MTGEGPARSHGRLTISASLKPRSLMDEPPRVRGAWRAKVITLFPEAFPGTLGLSLTGRALELGLWALETIDLRPFGEGRHRNVDDTPAGGGAGMVLRADILDRAIAAAAEGTPPDRAAWPVIALSPRGRPFDQAVARRLAAGAGVTLSCGRYEGIDQRVLDHHAIEELSLGDFVLTGGEIAAQALTLGDELIVADCDLDAGAYIKANIFNFAAHRRTEHYGLIVETTGVVPPRGR